MITYTHADIVAAGFTDTGISLGTSLPTLGGALKRAAALDYPVEAIATLRTEGGIWRVYIRPGVVKGYVEHPVLGKML